jgi:hypothetical protein
MTSRYFASAGPRSGPVLYGFAPGAIGVHQEGEMMPVGTALSARWDAERRALWTLNVHGADLPGRWVVIDREFVPAP